MMQTFSSSIKKCLHYVYFTFTMLQCLIFIIHFFLLFFCPFGDLYQSLFCLNFILTCLTFSVLDHSSQFLCVIKENNLISFFYICISFLMILYILSCKFLIALSKINQLYIGICVFLSNVLHVFVSFMPKTFCLG